MYLSLLTFQGFEDCAHASPSIPTDKTGFRQLGRNSRLLPMIFSCCGHYIYLLVAVFYLGVVFMVQRVSWSTFQNRIGCMCSGLLPYHKCPPVLGSTRNCMCQASKGSFLKVQRPPSIPSLLGSSAQDQRLRVHLVTPASSQYNNNKYYG